ncbi:MAG: Type 1 fimbrin D-mannose specific adhesin [Candidatus Erwinia impunctatus]|nr:Type 1 fimbrin D-mannose specific adhesin [Culicoides impunctatus]
MRHLLLWLTFISLSAVSLNAWSFSCRTYDNTVIPIGGGSADVRVNLAPRVELGQNLVVDLTNQIFCHNDFPETMTDYVTLESGSAFGGALINFAGSIKYSGSTYSFPMTSESRAIIYDSFSEKGWPTTLYLTPMSTAGGVAISAGSLVAKIILHQTNNINSDSFRFQWNIYANNSVVVPTGGCDVSARNVTVTLPDYPGSAAIPLSIYCVQNQKISFYLTGTTADINRTIFVNTSTDTAAKNVGIQLSRSGSVLRTNEAIALNTVGTSPASLGLTATYARTGGQVTAGNLKSIISLNFIYD